MMSQRPALTCDLAAVRLERYLENGLPVGAALAVAEHLETCAWCAQRLALIRLELGRRESLDLPIRQVGRA